LVIAACLLLSVALLLYVFAPSTAIASGPTKDRLAYLQERKEVVYENLRDLVFEHKAGKFTEADFQSMRNAMEEEAATILAEIARLERS
jgi:Skp family chaperone for outer membrane proteins